MWNLELNFVHKIYNSTIDVRKNFNSHKRPPFAPKFAKDTNLHKQLRFNRQLKKDIGQFNSRSRAAEKRKKKKEDTRFSCTVKKPGGMPDHVPTNLKGRERNFMFLRGQPTSGIYFNCDLLCEVKLRGSACTYARANAVRRYQIDVVHFVARLFLSPKKGWPAHGYEFSPAIPLSL